MGLLTKNQKMGKTSTDAIDVWNWTIRAGVSCPYAGACNAPGKCYAQSGAYQFGNVRKKHEANLALTKTDDFVQQMSTEIARLHKNATKRSRRLYIRIHDAGDFYSLEYLLKWLEVIRTLPQDITYYCYTKSVPLFKRLPGSLPSNFIVNYSMGGIADKYVDTSADKHVHIFASEQELVAANYVRNDADDSLAFDASVRKVGLVARWGILPTYVTASKNKVA
jgi:hypothetical protein